jgi:hypothetical protein
LSNIRPTLLSLVGIAKPDYMKGRIFLDDKKETTDNVFWGCRERSWLFSHSQFEYDCKSEG